MPSFFFPLWAQRNGFAELMQLLIVLLVIVVPTIIKFFGELTANKDRRRLEEQAIEKHLHDIFNRATTDGEVTEATNVRPRPKKERKRKRAELVLESIDDQPTRGMSLSRELAPQGEGSRFEVQPGTLDGSLVLTPSIEPTVQPTLDSMTGIYDTPPGSEHPNQVLLAADIYRMLTTPTGIRQAIVLGEILRRPTN